MRTFIVQVPDAEGEKVDKYARTKGVSSEVAASELLERAINENIDFLVAMRDYGDALARRRAKEGRA